MYSGKQRSLKLTRQIASLLTCQQVLEAYEVASKIPLITLLFQTAGELEPLDKTLHWVGHFGQRIDQLVVSRDSQALLRKLLFANSSKLSKDFKPDRHPVERDFTLSFVVPIGPLGFENIEKIFGKDGCEVCGERAVSRCSQCTMASYCGAGETLLTL